MIFLFTSHKFWSTADAMIIVLIGLSPPTKEAA